MQDGPTPAPGSWLKESLGKGLGLGPQNPSEVSSTRAHASQFCKSTTFLAKIPAMSPQEIDTEVGCLREADGGGLQSFEK